MDVFEERFDSRDQKVFNFAFFSDLHLESDRHNRKQFEYDINEAIARDCRVYIGGDTAELIMPTDTKRYVKSRDDISADAHLNEVTDRCFETLKPYVNYIDWMGWGNHEDSALKYNHYDFTLGLITLLNHERDSNLRRIHHGGYKSFIRWKFTRQKGGATISLTTLHFHGKGGGAPVTKGMIDINRLRADYEADLYWLGHKHTEITDKPERIALNRSGQVVALPQRAFFTAGYQNSYKEEDYSSGYKRSYEDTMINTTATGCAFLEIKVFSDDTYQLRLTN